MNDFDFLKNFSKNLNRERPIEPSDADWEKVAGSLDTTAKKKRRRYLLLLWAWPLAALLPLSTALLSTMARADRMQTEIAQLQSEAIIRNSRSISDTTIQHFSVIQYDTVYRTLVIRPSHWIAGSLLPATSNFDSLKVKRPALVLEQDESLAARIRKALSLPDALAHAQSYALLPDSLQQVAASRIPGHVQSKLFGALAALPVKTPGLIHIQPFRGPEPQMPPFNSSAKRPLASMIHRFQPHHAALGLSAGTLWPQVNGTKSYPGFTGGLAGQVAFGSHIRITGDLRWSRVWFNIKNGDQNALDIPALTPPSPDDVLEYVQVRQPSFEYALGLRYQLRPQYKLQPYFALAWTGANTLEHTLQYEFHNAATEAETRVELPYIEQNVFRSRWQVGLGTEWRLSKRLAAGGEAFWQNPIGWNGFLDGPRLGLTGYVFYFL